MNPIYGRFQQNQIPNNRMPMNMSNSNNIFENTSNLVNAYKDFRQNFQGNPRDYFNQLCQSGQMTQETFQYLSSMVNPFRTLLGRR